jgi:hypothetical protein
MPLGLRFQSTLQWRDGLPDTAGVDEVLLVCRRPGVICGTATRSG